MITSSEVKQILSRLPSRFSSGSGDCLINDISYIVYRHDVFEYGNTAVHSRHIDIEFSFGECYEICEATPLFQFICGLCNLPPLKEGQEIMIYKK